jgi:hypothetical protein
VFGGCAVTADGILVVMLRADAKMRAKLLKEHAADSAGRCPKCLAGGNSSGRVMAPCSLYLAAYKAEHGKVET